MLEHSPRRSQQLNLLKARILSEHALVSGLNHLPAWQDSTQPASLIDTQHDRKAIMSDLQRSSDGKRHKMSRIAAVRAWQEQHEARPRSKGAPVITSSRLFSSQNMPASSNGSVSPAYHTASKGEAETGRASQVPSFKAEDYALVPPPLVVSPHRKAERNPPLPRLERKVLASNPPVVSAAQKADSTAAPRIVKERNARNDWLDQENQFGVSCERVNDAEEHSSKGIASPREAKEERKYPAAGPIFIYDPNWRDQPNPLRDMIYAGLYGPTGQYSESESSKSDRSAVTSIDMDDGEFVLVNDAAKECRRARPIPEFKAPNWCATCKTTLDKCRNLSFIKHDVDRWDHRFQPAGTAKSRDHGLRQSTRSEGSVQEVETRRRTAASKRDSAML